VVYDDGREETVLSVPKYDFRWQLSYDLETPLRLPAGSKLVVTAHYDNSVNNKNNPAPDKEVYFRGAQNQSWEEMFTPLIQYSASGRALVEPTSSSRLDQEDPSGQDVLNIVEVSGCLEQNPTGTWVVRNGSVPVVSKTQAASSVALTTAETRQLGNRLYQLLGASFFNPSSYRGNKVAVKGVLITNANDSRVNVTSLQRVAATCAK